MSALARLRGLFEGTPKVKVRLVLRGRVGDGWYDEDRVFSMPVGATLGDVIEAAEKAGIRLRDAIAKSPHLAHTLMVNGERCPVDENLGMVLGDGAQVYLLAPLAGG